MSIEKAFLNGNTQAINAFSEMKNGEEYINQVDFEQLYYEEELSLYYELISEICNLLKELEINSPIEYSLAISYLIRLGFFSHDCKFQTLNDFDLLSCHGISIVNGTGRCRNFVGIHNDIFNKLNLYFEKFYCKKLRTKLKYDWMANHILGIIEHNNVLYGMDLINDDTLLCFENSMCLKGISVVPTGKLIYKPCVDYVLSGKTYDDIKKTIERFKVESKKQHISPREMYYISDNIHKKLQLSTKRFIDFYNRNEELINEIHNGIEFKNALLKK